MRRMMRRLAKRLLSTGRRPAEPASPPDANELFFWSPSGGRQNFGDYLSKVVVDQMLARRGLKITDPVETPRRILGVGSILHFSRPGDVVWGSGLNGKIKEFTRAPEGLDVRAVRGPITAEFLARSGYPAPTVFGDPAMLIPHLFPGMFRKTSVHPWAFVPNLHDLAAVKGRRQVVSPLLPWNRCIEEILSAELVLASSLHGLVLAEAFGVPARYVRLSETEGLEKYRDYVFGSGRASFEFATSIEAGLEMGGMPAPAYDPAPLMAAFPYDLWPEVR
jgi:pyruvyltransferase